MCYLKILIVRLLFLPVVPLASSLQNALHCCRNPGLLPKMFGINVTCVSCHNSIRKSGSHLQPAGSSRVGASACGSSAPEASAESSEMARSYGAPPGKIIS